MRFTIPFLLAIAVYVATVLGANQTSFTPNEDMLYDVVSASDAIGFRLERALGISEQLALMLGALFLTLPALATFHLFRIGFGGSVQSLIHEERLSRELKAEREKFAAARYANGGTVPASSVKEGQVLSGGRAGDNAKIAGDNPSASRGDRRDGRDRRNGKERRRGIGANIAAALRGKRGSATASVSTASGATVLSGAGADTSAREAGTAADDAKASDGGGLKDRWNGLLETKPDFSRLKNGAQNLRNKVSPRSSTTKLSLDDLADDAADKSS